MFPQYDEYYIQHYNIWILRNELTIFELSKVYTVMQNFGFTSFLKKYETNSSDKY